MFTENDVRRVAELSRLELSATEVKTFSNQIADVLQYIGTLNELNSYLDEKGVQPMVHPFENSGYEFATQTSVLAKDEVRPFENPQGLVTLSQESLYDNYKVPQVIGGSDESN